MLPSPIAQPSTWPVQGQSGQNFHLSHASVPLRSELVPCSIAEFFADILLTPLEATRIRLVSDRNYASGLTTGFLRMAREGGLKELYAGFVPILFSEFPSVWLAQGAHDRTGL